MNLNIHIERVIIEGAHAGRIDSVSLSAEIESELKRAIVSGQLVPSRRLDARQLGGVSRAGRPSKKSDPLQVGSQIVRAMVPELNAQSQGTGPKVTADPAVGGGQRI